MTSLSLCRSFVARSVRFRMLSSKNSYEEAIQKLNLLVTNKASVEQIRKEIQSGHHVCRNLEDMENFLLRTGVPMSKLDDLSVVHVAGTKGKGSTSAMCESILRAHGFRTGLFTSPHLVQVRERIRLDGAIIAREKFARHFHEVYDRLYATQAFDGDMPKYFAFLTVLAYNMFLKEKVDVAVVEVGIGGAVDFTNVLRKVPVVGISSLGFDHTSIIGHTIEQIARAKAGIMKRGCDAYTVDQPDAAMDVLRDVAKTVQCTLNIVPDYTDYIFPKDFLPQLQVDIEAYRMNASLAIQLSHAWMRYAKIQTLNRRNLSRKLASGKTFILDSPYIEDESKLNGVSLEEAIVTTVPKETVIGLQNCNWPGRFQVIEAEHAKFFLDGAHTRESVEICAKWFHDNSRSQDKILIFSVTGDRDVKNLLTPLKDIEFKSIFIVVPREYEELTVRNDNYSGLAQQELMTKCHKSSEIWNQVSRFKTNVQALGCVSDALNIIKSNCNKEQVSPCVLITGSLHLVGAALSILDPSLIKS